MMLKEASAPVDVRVNGIDRIRGLLAELTESFNKTSSLAKELVKACKEVTIEMPEED